MPKIRVPKLKLDGKLLCRVIRNVLLTASQVLYTNIAVIFRQEREGRQIFFIDLRLSGND
jgi:hypothetical protein